MKIKLFFKTVMPSEDSRRLQFNQNKKSDKAPFIIYVDFECIIEKIDRRKTILKIYLQ